MQPDWEIWLDMQFSPIIAKWMKDEMGWKVKSSYSLKLNNELDISIYKKAKAAGKVIIVSKDADFTDIINRMGSPPKLIQVSIGNCNNKTLWNLIKKDIQSAIKTLIETEVNVVEIE